MNGGKVWVCTHNISTVAKHQVISIHSANQISVALDQFQQFQTKILHVWWTTLDYEIIIYIYKKATQTPQTQ